MNIEDFYQSLLKLNRYETVGETFFTIQGQELSVEQYGYLKDHSRPGNPFLFLATPEAIDVQSRFRARLRQLNEEKGLPEQFFLPAGKKFETEQLLRYVNIPAHKHDFVELVCILNGHCEHIIEGEHYLNEAGDFTVIPPGIRHELHASPDCVCLTTKIRSSVFAEMFSDLFLENALLAAYFTHSISKPFYRCVLVLRCGRDAYIKETMLRIYAQQIEEKAYSEKIIIGLWNVLLAYMLQNYQDTVTFLVSNVVEHEEMLRILAFMYENYQTVTLAAVAEHFHVSVPHLSTKIHKLTGHTFSEHLKEYKLQRSAELLTGTKYNLERICEEVGYSDTAQFIRSFKAVYGMTPMKYRKGGHDG